MHGYEGCRKDFGVDHHKLHVRLYAIERKNQGGILEPCKQTITAQASGMTIYDHMEPEA